MQDVSSTPTWDMLKAMRSQPEPPEEFKTGWGDRGMTNTLLVCLCELVELQVGAIAVLCDKVDAATKADADLRAAVEKG